MPKKCLSCALTGVLELLVSEGVVIVQSPFGFLVFSWSARGCNRIISKLNLSQKTRGILERDPLTMSNFDCVFSGSSKFLHLIFK